MTMRRGRGRKEGRMHFWSGEMREEGICKWLAVSDFPAGNDFRLRMELVVCFVEGEGGLERGTNK
jgi:hypothetical protein